MDDTGQRYGPKGATSRFICRIGHYDMVETVQTKHLRLVEKEGWQISPHLALTYPLTYNMTDDMTQTLRAIMALRGETPNVG